MSPVCLGFSGWFKDGFPNLSPKLEIHCGVVDFLSSSACYGVALSTNPSNEKL